MISVPSEISGPAELKPVRGWIFYDRDCRSCSSLALSFRSTFARRGFSFEPLQERWVQRELQMSEVDALTEMRVLTRKGNILGGADAVVFLASRVWWLSPLSWLARLPGARRLLSAIYQWVA